MTAARLAISSDTPSVPAIRVETKPTRFTVRNVSDLMSRYLVNGNAGIYRQE